MGKKQDQYHISESLEQNFWVKLTYFNYLIWIRDGKNSDPGSRLENFNFRIRDKHPGSATLPLSLSHSVSLFFLTWVDVGEDASATRSGAFLTCRVSKYDCTCSRRKEGLNLSHLRDSIENYNFFSSFFMYDVIQHCFICRPSDSIVSEDTGINR